MLRSAQYGGMRLAVLLAMLTVTCGPAFSQAYKVRPAVRARPMDTFIDSLTVAASPSLVAFALVPKGVAQGSSGVAITTTWSSHGNAPSINLYGYFNSAAAALTDGKTPAHLIPSSAVLGQMTSGVPTSFTAFTQTTGYGSAGASLLLMSTPVVLRDDTRTDVLNLEIDLSGVNNLPAGTYTGTLTIQATMF